MQRAKQIGFASGWASDFKQFAPSEGERSRLVLNCRKRIWPHHSDIGEKIASGTLTGGRLYCAAQKSYYDKGERPAYQKSSAGRGAASPLNLGRFWLIMQSDHCHMGTRPANLPPA